MRIRGTPYQRIVLAAEAGVGVRLSPEEVRLLALDTAITEAAANDTETGELPDPSTDAQRAAREGRPPPRIGFRRRNSP